MPNPYYLSDLQSLQQAIDILKDDIRVRRDSIRKTDRKGRYDPVTKDLIIEGFISPKGKKLKFTDGQDWVNADYEITLISPYQVFAGEIIDYPPYGRLRVLDDSDTNLFGFVTASLTRIGTIPTYKDKKPVLPKDVI